MSGRPGHRCTHPYPYVSKHTLPPAMSSGRLMKAPYRRRKKKAAAKSSEVGDEAHGGSGVKLVPLTEKGGRVPDAFIGGESLVWQRGGSGEGEVKLGEGSRSMQGATTAEWGGWDEYRDGGGVSLLDMGLQVEQILAPQEQAKQRQKKERQWDTWRKDVIPRLVEVYMRVDRETESFRERGSRKESGKEAKRCSCVKQIGRREISVACVYFESAYLNTCW